MTEYPTLPVPLEKRALIDHLATHHGMSRLRLNRTRRGMLRWNHDIRHRTEPGVPFGDDWGNVYPGADHRHV